MEIIQAKVSSNGRVTLPIKVRKLIAVEEGEEIIFTIEEDKVGLMNPRDQLDQTVTEFQKLVRLAQEETGNSLSIDGFLKERREEAKREEEKQWKK